MCDKCGNEVCTCKPAVPPVSGLTAQEIEEATYRGYMRAINERKAERDSRISEVKKKKQEKRERDEQERTARAAKKQSWI